MIGGFQSILSVFIFRDLMFVTIIMIDGSVKYIHYTCNCRRLNFRDRLLLKVAVNLFLELFSIPYYFSLQVSFDDVCYMDSVITRVALSETQPEKYSISKPHIKQTKKLLKEALAAERGEEEVLQDEEGVLLFIVFEECNPNFVLVGLCLAHRKI